MYQTLIENGFPIFLALFLGPLTDKYGYKPLMLYSMSGYIFYTIVLITSHFFPLLPPWYLLTASVPLGLSGGTVTLMISTYGFMAAQTTLDNRSYRLAAMNGTWEIGTVIGYILGSIVSFLIINKTLVFF